MSVSQPDPLLPVLRDDELSERAAAVFADIRATRNTDFVNNIWRVLANDPPLLEQTWAEVKGVLGADGELDVLTKQLIYIAVSVAQGCNYCIRSHTAAARNLGLTDAQFAELHTVIGVAAKTNRLVQGLQVPIDDAFL
ncbi:MAG: carboxymuconolactone decarboxylase family protein [Corynebacterium matruchotii]|uniref:carboxymuconolactone decarboxylase family protein n=1 Tax=Corynebacterium matruchotii TaxID=43768 RepID=UPI00360E8A67